MPRRFRMPLIRSTSRRQLLQVGGLGMIGLSLPQLLKAELQPAATAQNGGTASSVKSCVLFILHGGPSQLDTFDMKPDAPAEVRGEFKPIMTTVPGVQIVEHLPRLA